MGNTATMSNSYYTFKFIIANASKALKSTLLVGLISTATLLSLLATAQQPQNTFAGDVDGNGQQDALTDGLLVLRYLFGFRGATLINGAIGTGASRTTAAEIEAQLGLLQQTILDIDGNGQADALTDGLLNLRYLFGFRGDTLINGAIGTGSSRSTAASIESYMVASVSGASTPSTPSTRNFERGTLGNMDSVPNINCDTIYTSASSLASNASRTMPAGTTLCLADGSYGDFELDFGGAGTAAMPITVAAENPGRAIITGETSVRMSGSYAVLQGLVFKGGQTASSDFLQTRNGSGRDFCSNCRITEIAVIDLQSDSSGIWLNIYGVDNRVDHSWFTGKVNASPILSVNREIPSGGTAADIPISGTIIDHNYFGDRPPVNGKAYAEGSDNGYEAIRIGTSPGHAFDSNVRVEYNYFERIDAEAEVISNKAGNNTIANNTIRDSYGSLTTRHGANATIEGNFIMGDGHPYAGGIRIIDDGHRVINNYIEGARYKNTRFHGGIVIHNSDGSTSNGYQDVFNVLIAHNTIVDSVNSVNVNGGNRTTNPERVFFVNNIIDDAIGPIITQAGEGLPANSSYAGNYVFGQSFSDVSNITSANGFTNGDIAMTEDSLAVSRPTNAVSVAADVSANIGTFAAITDDMDGNTRQVNTQSGSDHVSTLAQTKGLLTSNDVGPINYRPDFSQGYVQRINMINPGFDTTAGWAFTSPSTVTNNVSDRFSGSTAVVSGAGSLSQNVALAPSTTYTLTAFTKGPVQLSVSNGGNTLEWMISIRITGLAL